jgi:hypothetical protein
LAAAYFHSPIPNGHMLAPALNGEGLSGLENVFQKLNFGPNLP